MKTLIAILALALVLGAGTALAGDLAAVPWPAAEIVPAARLSPPPEDGRGSWQRGFGLDYGRRFGPGYYSGPGYGLGYPYGRAYPFLIDPFSPQGSRFGFGFGLGPRGPYPYGFGYGDPYGRSPYSSGWYSPFGGSYLGRGGQAPRFGEDAPQGGPIGAPGAR